MKVNNLVLISGILILIVLIILISCKRKLVSYENFQRCSKDGSFKATCNKKTIYGEISRLEDKIEKLQFIIKSKGVDNRKLNKLNSWFEKQQKKDSQFKKGAQKNVEDSIKQFAEETENRMNNDEKKGDKNHSKEFGKERRKLNKLYNPLNLKKL
tara:strand:+ start:2082 stop:2546 length:465 start_codon:yes stop_codon:yes gene_type:complete